MSNSIALLDESEAAIKLGVTKELLFAYTRNSPKKQFGHNDRLRLVREGQECKFSIVDLDAWNSYLLEPWSATGAERPPIPSYIDHYLKIECGGKCAVCGKGHKLQNAHISEYSISLSHHHHNLIRLCTDCHSKYDDKLISQAELYGIKNRLIQNIRESLQKDRIFSRTAVYRLPKPNPFFVGRVNEQLTLKEFLANERVIIVEGIGGIGKTQLVLQTLQANQERPLIWIDVESYRNLRDLKLALLTSLMQEKRDSVVSTSIFDLLNESHLLVILDGLDRIQSSASDETTDFLNELVTLTSEPTFLITTQIELSLNCRFCHILLPALSESESSEVLRIGCEDQQNIRIFEDHIGWLTNFAQGHALCLRIILGLLRYYKNSEYVVEQIRLAGSEALKDPTRQEQNRSSSLNACLTAAYECLSHEQKRLLQYVSNFPVGCMERRVRNWQSNEYSRNISELRRFFFIEVRRDEILGTDRLFLVNPVRQFIRQQWKEHSYSEAAAIQLEVAKSVMMEVSVLDHKYFESSTEAQDLQYGLIRVELEFSNFLQALRYAEWLAERRERAGKNIDECLNVISGITFGLSKYFFIRGLLKEGIYIIEPGIEALEKLQLFRAAATQYVMVANMRARMHDYEGEIEATERLVSLGNRTDDPRIIALASLSLGGVMQRAHKLTEAAKFYRSAIDYFRTPTSDCNDGDDERYYTGMLGMTLKSLGEIYEAWKKPQDALEYHLEALECVKTIGDHTNLGSIYHQLGNCYADLGQPQKSVLAYRQALTSFLQFGYSQYISNALGEMGKVVAETNCFDASLDEFLTEEVVSVGLLDLNADVMLLLASQQRTIDDDGMMLSKLFGIVKLISFSSRAGMLTAWAQDFRENIFTPLRAEEDGDNFQQEMFMDRLSLTINLAQLSGELSKPKDTVSIAKLRRLCEVMETLWPSSRPSEWLAALLKCRGLIVN